jgi:hypothetical protein
MTMPNRSQLVPAILAAVAVLATATTARAGAVGATHAQAARRAAAGPVRTARVAATAGPTLGAPTGGATVSGGRDTGTGTDESGGSPPGSRATSPSSPGQRVTPGLGMRAGSSVSPPGAQSEPPTATGPHDGEAPAWRARPAGPVKAGIAPADGTGAAETGRSQATGTGATDPRQRTPAAGTGSGRAPVAPSPTQTVPTNNDPTQAATTQAVNEYGLSSSSGNQPVGAGASSATSQTIWQLQISGCASHCQGTKQSQSAEQQTTTVQAPDPAPGMAPSTTSPAGGDGSPQPTRHIAQLQLGCLAHCFGTTTTGTATARGIERTVEQILADLMPDPPSLAAPPATHQSTIDQTIHQRQNGAASQVQFAAQSSTTIQLADGAAQLAATLGPPTTRRVSPAVGALNQTQQGIVQLQLGCLTFCTGTQQTQDASQSSVTIQAPSSTAIRPTESGGAVVNVVRQVIYQLQVGCLFWCYNARAHQSASQIAVQFIGTPAPRSSSPPALSVASPAASRPGSAGPGRKGSGRGTTAGRVSSGAGPHEAPLPILADGTSPPAGRVTFAVAESPPPLLSATFPRSHEPSATASGRPIAEKAARRRRESHLHRWSSVPSFTRGDIASIRPGTGPEGTVAVLAALAASLFLVSLVGRHRAARHGPGRVGTTRP